MARTVMWDFDGTLATRPGLWSQTMVEVLDAQRPGHGRGRDDFRPALRDAFPWHRPDEPHLDLLDPEAWWARVNRCLHRAFVETGFEDDAEQCTAAFREVFLDPGSWRVYPDTSPALQALSDAGWRHVIVSNHVPELAGLVAGLGLAEHFETIINSAEVGYEKPHPEIFRAALAAVDGGRVVMVGDNPVADVQGARAVGVDGFLVRREAEGHRTYPYLSAVVDELLER